MTEYKLEAPCPKCGETVEFTGRVKEIGDESFWLRANSEDCGCGAKLVINGWEVIVVDGI